MDATVAAGWIGGLSGLGGALLGAGASLLGTRMSQRHAAEQARIAREHEVADAKEQRLFDLARAALDGTLLELHALQKVIQQAQRQRPAPDQQLAWERPVEEHLERISALLHRIPDPQVRQRLQRVIYVADRHHLAGPSYRHALTWLFA